MKTTSCAAVLAAGLAGLPAYALELEASVDWARRVDLSTQVTGRITEVGARTGDAVRAGQVLVRLDPRGFEAAVEKARARVESTQEAREEAQRELDRAHELYDRTVLSEHELQLAKIGFTSADAAWRAAKAMLTQAELDLEYSTIEAPFDGVVVASQVAQGETVVSELQAKPLLTLADRERMVARGRIAYGDLSGIREGQPATVIVGGRQFKGTVARIGLEPVAKTPDLFYPVDVEFAPGDSILRAGEPARISLP